MVLTIQVLCSNLVSLPARQAHMSLNVWLGVSVIECICLTGVLI